MAVAGLEDIGLQLADLIPSPLGTTLAILVLIGAGAGLVRNADISSQAKTLLFAALAGAAIGIVIMVPEAYGDAKDYCESLGSRGAFGEFQPGLRYNAECLAAFGADGP
jgi:hypothetical protein